MGGPLIQSPGVTLGRGQGVSEGTPCRCSPLPCSTLNSSDIKVLGVDLLPGYYDPFSGRTLTKGEVGCFLSHYNIWKEVWGHSSHGVPKGPLALGRDSMSITVVWCPVRSWPQYGPEWCTSIPSPQIVSRGLERSVVFEDDVRFEAAFPARLQRLMEELEQAQQDWDLM